MKVASKYYRAVAVIHLSDNLPAIARATGGDLATVLSWEQHRDLPVATKVEITQVVRRFKELNGVDAVDMLADLAGNEAVDLNPWFARLVNEFSLPNIHLAITCLTEAGIRSPAEATGNKADFEKGEVTRGQIEGMLSLINIIEDHLEAGRGRATSLNGTLVLDIIERFDDWDEVRRADRALIEHMLDDTSYSPSRGESSFDEEEDNNDE